MNFVTQKWTEWKARLPDWVCEKVGIGWRWAIFFFVVGVFATYMLTSGERVNLISLSTDMGRIALSALAPVAVIIFACMFLFDFALSFKEFGKAIRFWEKKPENVRREDALIVLAMAIRSGLVFLGIAIVVGAGLEFIDFRE